MIPLYGQWSAIFVCIVIFQVRGEQAVSLRFWPWFLSRIFDCGGIWLGWAGLSDYQKNRWQNPYYCILQHWHLDKRWVDVITRSHLTKSSSIDWICLGEQSCIWEQLFRNESDWMQRQRWSLMTVLYLTVRNFWFTGALTQAWTGSLHWNTICGVCSSGKEIANVLIMYFLLSAY
jgi:hypothetical protein